MLLSFKELQGEYSLVMGIVRAVRAELVHEDVPEAVVRRVDDILRNEAQVHLSIEESVGVPAAPTAKRTAKRSTAQEALRAEIEKDAAALLGFAELSPRLERRRCGRPRLEALRTSAQALAGKLAARAAKKGSAQAATSHEHQAVAAQRVRWGGVYRLLAALARQDERVRLLLQEAAR